MHFYITNACGIDLVFLVDLPLKFDLALDTGSCDPIGGPILIHS